MFTYDAEKVKLLLREVIQQHLPKEKWQWLEHGVARFSASREMKTFNILFASMPRHTGKELVQVDAENKEALRSVRPFVTIDGWSIDRLCRVWLLLHLPTDDKQGYVKKIESLFMAAEMNELVALYSSLPLLAFPEAWKLRCAEGIRSNMGPVLESIMCANPYPSEQLEEAAWNQLVLKAIFTEKPIHQIVGLDKRANQSLANSLSDYAHERWAAHRTVNPLLWRCVINFMDERIFEDIKRIAYAERSAEREAAALVCEETSYAPAKELLNKSDELKRIIKNERVTWDTLAQKVQLSDSLTTNEK